jgi:hypothetical protein
MIPIKFLRSAANRAPTCRRAPRRRATTQKLPSLLISLLRLTSAVEM